MRSFVAHRSRTVGVLLTLGLGACGNADDAALRLSIWEQMEPAEQRLLAEHLQEFESDHPGVRVDVVHFETENLRNNYQTAALARTGPDLVYGPSDHVGPFSIMGLIEALENVLPADSLAVFLDDAKPSLEGHVLRLADQVGNHLTLVLNREYVDHAPTDTQDMLDIARANTIDTDGDGRTDRYGIVFNLTEPFWLVPWLGGFGGWVMDENAAPTLDTPAMREALAFVRLMVEEGLVPPSCDYPLADTLFKQGSAAMTINGPWSWEAYREVGIDVGLAVLPRIAGRDSWPQPMTSSKGYSLNRWVPQTRRDLVIELLSFLTSARVVGHISQELGTLPSRQDVSDWPRLQDNPTLRASWDQLVRGRLMPVVPEMRVLWDVMRPGLQQVVSGRLSPEEASRAMQESALRKIEELRR
jgi:maltose-binding protein MalE